MLDDRLDQLTNFCKSLLVFYSGAKVSLMNAFNISARKKREKSHLYSIENDHPFSVILLI